MAVLTGLPDFSPVNTVTPFTYRDNDTFLTQLETLKEKANELVETVNANDQENASQHSAIVKQLVDQFNAALAELTADLEARIDAVSVDSASANDPTTGQRNAALSQVISNVYDNSRVYAWFAIEADELERTAAEWDALNFSARHFDLGATYPVIHDSL
jgi:phenylalanyl-tRNA synthetase alpha subunit